MVERVPSVPSLGRTITKYLLLFVPLLLLIYDGIAYIVWGNDATISKILYDANDAWRGLSYTITFILGGIVAHFWIPQHIEVKKE